MIPADIVTRLRLSNELASAQPATPTQKLTDALSDFVPGQRVMANIQALLPNGTYRAMIAQREITLALPFSAKPGDALELKVVDSNGKLALAVVTGKPGEDGSEDASVRTRLTQAGRLIGDLLAGMDKEGGKRPSPAPLNSAQPVLTKLPETGAELAPALKEAITKSGMFYEAHQARWVQGRLPTESLLQEPQGKLSVSVQAAAQTATPAAPQIAAEQAARTAPPPNTAGPDVVRVVLGPAIAQEAAPLVQQQLEALATHTYAWQGQVWPGQNMDWEIIEEENNDKTSEDSAAANWTTRLHLKLPNLGGVEATLRLQGNRDIEISLKSDSDSTRQKLSGASAPLLQQFETVGLSLSSFAVAHHARTEE